MLKKPVALLDVDHTLLDDEGALNTDLVDALCSHGITDCYLFTNMSIRDVVEKVIDPNTVSRNELITTLTALGITVHAVITPADPIHDKGLGAAFRDFYEPQYARLIAGEKWTEENISTDVALNASKKSFQECHHTLAGRAREMNYESVKGLMYLYFVEHRPDWVGSVMFFDDDAEVNIADVELAQKSLPLEQRLLLDCCYVNKRWQMDWNETMIVHWQRYAVQQTLTRLNEFRALQQYYLPAEHPERLLFQQTCLSFSQCAAKDFKAWQQERVDPDALIGVMSGSEAIATQEDLLTVWQKAVAEMKAAAVDENDAKFLKSLAPSSSPSSGTQVLAKSLISSFEQDRERCLVFLGQVSSLELVFSSPREVHISWNNAILLFDLLPIPLLGINLLEIALASGVDINEARSLDGYTPLHFAVRFDLLDQATQLIQAGASLEILDCQGRTPLDIAIQYDVEGVDNQFNLIALLIEAGAGRKLSLESALCFQNRYKAVALKLVRQLLDRNADFSWGAALEGMTQTEETGEKVVVSGKGYLKPALWQQFFTEGVVSSRSMWFKKNPELLGCEFMVKQLAYALFGNITPNIALLKFSKQQESWYKVKEAPYPVLASKHISGHHLLEALRDHPEEICLIDKESFSEAAILAMLIGPYGGRGDNYILEPTLKKGRTIYRLISIDNKHAFARPEEFGIKTILFCMNEMREPIDASVRQLLLSIDPYKFVKTWLELLGAIDSDHKELFTDADGKISAELLGRIGVLFKPSIVMDVYQKLVVFQQVLTESSDVSLMTLLSAAMPELSKDYLQSFIDHPEADAVQIRFDGLTKALSDSVKVKQRQNHSVTSNSKFFGMAMQMPRMLEKKSALQDEEIENTVEAGLLYLEKTHKEQVNLSAASLALQVGNTGLSQPSSVLSASPNVLVFKPVTMDEFEQSVAAAFVEENESLEESGASVKKT